jgi:hypothetical protein
VISSIAALPPFGPTPFGPKGAAARKRTAAPRSIGSGQLVRVNWFGSIGSVFAGYFFFFFFFFFLSLSPWSDFWV